MNLGVSTWSIHNPVAIALLFLLLALAGAAGFAAMKIQNFPDIDFPSVIVTAALPGAAPAQLENDVARRIEDALANLQGLKHIKSSLSGGVATLTVEFEVGKPVQEAMDEVRDAVASVRGRLPPDLQDPVVRKVETAGTPVAIYAIASDARDEASLSWFVDSEVARRLLEVPGVAAITRVGGADREIRVELDPAHLLALRTTAAEISAQLRELQQEAPGGQVEIGGSRQSVRTLATVQTAQQLAQMDVSLPDGRRLRLDRIANVVDSRAEPSSKALLDGRPVVAFSVLRARGAGEVDVARSARAAIDELRAAHPDVAIVEAVSYVDPIVQNYRGSLMLLVEGALLAVLVVFWFLRDGRATAIAAVALPLSVLPTFAAMQALGFSLNTVSLLSLSLVVGVLVDDAIVEIENIERHLRMGKSPLRASIDAANEIGLAVVATTFTLVAVFLPTSLMGGTIGRFFVQFGWTAAIAVFFSLVVARMLTPTMTAHLLRAPAKRPRSSRWIVAYLRLVRGCLEHRAATVAIALGFVAAGLVLAAGLPGEFMPPDDGDQTQVTLTLPPGSLLSQTERVAEQARAAIAAHPHVRSVYTAIGSGSGLSDGPGEAPAVSDVGAAVLVANLVPRAERDGTTRQDIEAQLRAALAPLPGVRIGVGDGGSEGYELVLASDDGETLARHARLVERELRGIAGVGAVTSSASLVQPEWVVRPDFARASRLGVVSSDIARTLRVATRGDHAQRLAKVNLSERQVPVVVRLSDAGRDDPDLLRRLPVPGAFGPVPLGSVAELELAAGPAELTRYDRARNVSINVEPGGQPLGAIERAALALPSLKHPPPGIRMASAGGAELMGELVDGFLLAMAAGVLCVYVVLVLLLKDFLQPLTVLAALALSIPGAFLALTLTGATLSMPSMIGLIMLMGVTTKNSILLVDYIVMARRDHGMNRRRAVLDACRKRARPIVMTSIAMGAGMLPIALGFGADPSFRAPMAIVVIGGLVSSTAFCLLLIPVLYTCVDDALRALR